MFFGVGGVVVLIVEECVRDFVCEVFGDFVVVVFVFGFDGCGVDDDFGVVSVQGFDLFFVYLVGYDEDVLVVFDRCGYC